MSDKQNSKAELERCAAEAQKAMAKLVQAIVTSSLSNSDISTVVASLQPAGKPPKKAAKKITRVVQAARVGHTVKAPKAKKRGPAKGSKAEARPCPVTGILNTHRRFSYLMPEVRTKTNLRLYRGWVKKTASLAAPAPEQQQQPVAG